MTKKPVSADNLISVVLKGIDDVKGEDIQLIDLREIENTVCDYFIVCSGNSNTQVNAISGSVQKLVSKELRDYVNVVVHIFQKHIRAFYDIESLWGDAKITKINPD